MAKGRLGIIGGSGLSRLDVFTQVERVELETPFGRPSDAFFCGKIGQTEAVFLARHGQGHRILPTEINFRANLYGLKQLGVEYLVSISSCGSLKEELKPGDFVVPDQFIDRTFKRPATFFGNGLVVHVSVADPVCPILSNALAASARAAGANVRQGGIYLCIEGPQFSTRAESALYRSWGADVISMTAMQEARLAREAELCYATLALVTDYDCWHQSVAAVDIGEILRVMALNVEAAQQAIVRLAQSIGSQPRSCACAEALKGAIVTDRSVIPPATAADLRLIIGKYL